MSQITSMTSGGGGGGVASVTGGTGINITGTATNPVVNLTSPVAIANGGTNNTTYTTDGVIYYDGTKFNSTAAGTAGQVLTSNGAGVAPTYQASATAVTSITGNTGAAQTGAISLITSNSVPLFAGAAGTITLNFALTDNLLLGSSGSITTGNTNCGYGKLAAASISSGASNTFIGYEAGVAYTTGSNSTAIGGFALYQAVAGASNNTAIGYSSMSNMTGAGVGNTCLGLNSGTAYTTTEGNNIIIGNTGIIADNGKIRIGTNGTHTAAFITGIDTVNVGSVAKVVTMASDQLGTATLTAGSNITITPSANLITISTTSPGFTWTVTTVNASLVAANGYIANKAGLLTMTLPASGAIGDIIEITGINTAVGWRIAQNANQQIFFGTGSTSVGVGGYLEATAIRDSVRMVCVVSGASTVWNVLSSVGNITVV